MVATERNQGRIVIVANKVACDEDVARIEAAFRGHTIMVVPADDVVDRADRQGLSPLDINPDAPAIAALELVAAALAS